MSPYQPPTERLAAEPASDWTASFAELEAILGASLPPEARADPAWWRAEEGAVQTAAWREPGWRVADVDMAGESVRFTRAGLPVAAPSAPQADRSGRPMLMGASLALGAVSLIGLTLALRLKRRQG